MEQDHYSYFDIDGILEAQGFSKKELAEGAALAADSANTLSRLSTGYLSDGDEMVCIAEWSVTDRRRTIFSRVIFGSDSMKLTSCSCPACSRNSYGWYYSDTNDRHCAYLAGLMLRARKEMETRPLGDATSRKGRALLDTLSERRLANVTARAGERNQQVSLEPLLRRSGADLTLFFRIAEKKSLMVRDLFEFIGHVDKGETAVYGSRTQISHKLDNFDPRSQEWISYIREVLQEEERARARMARQAEKSYIYYREKKYPGIELYGWRLDRFFDMIREGGISYEETRGSGEERPRKVKSVLTVQDADPQIPLQITPDIRGKKETFHGVHVSLRIPDFYYGTEHLYYIDRENARLCRTDRARLRVLEPLMKETEDGYVTFEVGRLRLSEFYYSVLPQLGDAVTLMEENPELIRTYLPPDLSFRFYLDVTEEGDITCGARAWYEERRQEVSLLDQLREGLSLPVWRMPDREREVLYPLLSMFHTFDPQNDLLTTDGDEDAVYQLLEEGISKLEELGEVKATSRFRRLNVIQHVTVSVGVAMKSDLLDLEITTKDLSGEELLEILHSQSFRKRYYRLKSGNFLNTEDPTLRMLNEMLTSLQITDKEFLKGNIHLPVYRALYLNRLLEENENVYNTRDARFRSMVKSFKTVQEADYEVPVSLRGILRGYQVTGYKWLRTLKSSGFGGILADEMGLGKTLQTIAVLLALREEHGPDGPAGTSLIVCPASLVYNWQEEIARFAPALSVLPVTGSQSERAQKLTAWRSYDVLITSYDLLKRDIASYEEKSFDLEVIDEAQYIKNHTTSAARAVKVIHAANRLALTGTPVENRLSELWSIFDYLMPGYLYRYETFRRQLETPIVKNQDQDALHTLQKMTGPFILRRRKADVLRDLPDKLEENRYVRMEGEQRRLYDAQVVQMQHLLSGQSDEEFQKSRLRILAGITRLRQLCCDPSLCIEAYHGGSAKLDGCMDLIASAVDGGHRVLLFSQFVSMLELLQKRLESAGLAFYCITGSTPKEKRLQLVKSFNTGTVPVFLVSLKAGGVGLNLTGADVVIHYDPWWNLAAENQATDRAHRIGQTRKVTVYKMIAAQSIEERIQKLQETKKELADQVLEGSGGELTQMSREDLLALLS